MPTATGGSVRERQNRERREPKRLGTVSLIGPVRMDYAGAIATVREAAWQLSRYADEVYEG